MNEDAARDGPDQGITPHSPLPTPRGVGSGEWGGSQIGHRKAIHFAVDDFSAHRKAVMNGIEPAGEGLVIVEGPPFRVSGPITTNHEKSAPRPLVGLGWVGLDDVLFVTRDLGSLIVHDGLNPGCIHALDSGAN